MVRRFFLLSGVLSYFYLIRKTHVLAQPKEEEKKPDQCIKIGALEEFVSKIFVLEGYLKEFGIDEMLKKEKGENTRDVAAFCYHLSTLSEGMPLGFWSSRIEGRSLLFAYVLCYVKRTRENLTNLFKKLNQFFGGPHELLDPKNTMACEDEALLASIRPCLVMGSYQRVFILLSIKRDTFNITHETLETRQEPLRLAELVDLAKLQEFCR